MLTYKIIFTLQTLTSINILGKKNVNTLRRLHVQLLEKRTLSFVVAENKFFIQKAFPYIQNLISVMTQHLTYLTILF